MRLQRRRRGPLQAGIFQGHTQVERRRVGRSLQTVCDTSRTPGARTTLNVSGTRAQRRSMDSQSRSGPRSTGVAACAIRLSRPFYEGGFLVFAVWAGADPKIGPVYKYWRLGRIRNTWARPRVGCGRAWGAGARFQCDWERKAFFCAHSAATPQATRARPANLPAGATAQVFSHGDLACPIAIPAISQRRRVFASWLMR